MWDSLGFLNLHVEAILTAGADNGMLALLSRKTEIVLAGWTLLIYVGFLITLFTFL